MAKIFKGQYDLIGFDPRGVGSSLPYVSCFESALEEHAFDISTQGFALNLPANVSAFTPGLREDLARQMDSATASISSLAHHCVARSGELLPFLGTEFVVRDIDLIAQLIEGEDTRINYWGFSYGTTIARYMVKILPPVRLGRIIIDGVMDPAIWKINSENIFNEGLQDVDDVLGSFASSCLAAGPNCTLNVKHNLPSTSALLSKIDATLDTLYRKPVPVYGMDVPAVATAYNLRTLMFQSMYNIRTWDALAERLSEAFEGNFTQIADRTLPRVPPDGGRRSDSSAYPGSAVMCADAEPYTDAYPPHPPPTNIELTQRVLENLEKYSHRFGELHWVVATCHLWAKAGMAPSRSRYDGTFELEDDTLETPMLILSNTYDPVAPLQHAMHANEQLGNNARLIQQLDGWGHCALNQVSYCTARATQDFMVNGKIPDQNHTLCKVDEVPFVPFEDMASLRRDDEDELRKA